MLLQALVQTGCGFRGKELADETKTQPSVPDHDPGCFAYAQVCMYVCVCVYVYAIARAHAMCYNTANKNIHTYIHTHIHTHSRGAIPVVCDAVLGLYGYD